MAARNLITDVAGVKVGHADDARLASGVTAILFDRPAAAAVDVRGGAPGTRETDLLDAHRTVAAVDAIVLSGGSAFGLDSSSGVQAWLREHGRGFAIGDIRVPIVCGAALFDMLNGGEKSWGRFPPFRDLGYAAANAASLDFALGTAGAGFGATTFGLKGGLGSASAITRDGHTVGAIVAVNAAAASRSATAGISGRRHSSRTASSAVMACRSACQLRHWCRRPRAGPARTPRLHWLRPTRRSTKRSAISSR
jgi:L-aminopeptidase/D-esterase-like protein